jgi:hypothetical protein
MQHSEIRHDGIVESLAINANGERLATGSQDGTVRVQARARMR